MAKKKPAKPPAISGAPVPFGWLETPKVVDSPPLDWLTAPNVTIGHDENLTGILRPNDLPASKREQKTAASEAAQLAHLPKPSEPAPISLTAAPPKKQKRQRRPNPPSERDRQILSIPRTASLQEYCDAGIRLREGWARAGGPKTMLEAYQAKDERLLKLIRNDRSNVWERQKHHKIA